MPALHPGRSPADVSLHPQAADRSLIPWGDSPSCLLADCLKRQGRTHWAPAWIRVLVLKKDPGGAQRLVSGLDSLGDEGDRQSCSCEVVHALYEAVQSMNCPFLMLSLIFLLATNLSDAALLMLIFHQECSSSNVTVKS